MKQKLRDGGQGLLGHSMQIESLQKKIEQKPKDRARDGETDYANGF